MSAHTAPNETTSAGSDSARQRRKTQKSKPAKSALAGAAAKKTTTGKKAKSAKKAQAKKIKLVRDSYTMPENDYARLVDLKKTCLKAGVAVKKSELLRAGLTVLSSLSIAALLKTIAQIEKIKGRRRIPMP